MKTEISLPIYAKISLIILGLFIFVNILFMAKGIIIPIIYSIILSIVLSPVINFLVKRKVNRAFAIGLVLSITLLILAGFITFLAAQASRFSDALPQLSQKLQVLINQLVTWGSVYFELPVTKINEWINNGKVEAMSNASSVIGTTLTTVGGVLATIFLIPVYIAMMLYYKPLLVTFIHKVFGSSNDLEVSEILIEIKNIIQSYLVGLFSEFAIVALLNSIGLLILGIDYAILLGISSAMLNIIPYLGGVITMIIFAIIALITKPPIYVLYVVGVYAFIQFIDNNYLVPKIVGSKVKLNALISVLIVILGAAIWGIHGMFLSIPLTAIVKLILDRIESLKPWGFLLGDNADYTTISKIKAIAKE
jgi:predicted PurR-regulated permease PerM